MTTAAPSSTSTASASLPAPASSSSASLPTQDASSSSKKRKRAPNTDTDADSSPTSNNRKRKRPQDTDADAIEDERDNRQPAGLWWVMETRPRYPNEREVLLDQLMVTQPQAWRIWKVDADKKAVKEMRDRRLRTLWDDLSDAQRRHLGRLADACLTECFARLVRDPSTIERDHAELKQRRLVSGRTYVVTAGSTANIDTSVAQPLDENKVQLLRRVIPDLDKELSAKKNKAATARAVYAWGATRREHWEKLRVGDPVFVVEDAGTSKPRIFFAYVRAQPRRPDRALAAFLWPDHHDDGLSWPYIYLLTKPRKATSRFTKAGLARALAHDDNTFQTAVRKACVLPPLAPAASASSASSAPSVASAKSAKPAQGLPPASTTTTTQATAQAKPQSASSADATDWLPEQYRQYLS